MRKLNIIFILIISYVLKYYNIALKGIMRVLYFVSQIEPTQKDYHFASANIQLLYQKRGGTALNN